MASTLIRGRFAFQRVLLVNPPDVESKYKTFLGLTVPPLGLGYIAAVLEQNDVKVSVIDAPTLNMSFDQLQREVRRLKPEIVGIQATTPTIRQAMRVARVVKDELPLSTVVMGGYHVTFLPEQTLTECLDVDICVRGEGEYTMLEVAKTLTDGEALQNVRGISFRRGDRSVVHTPDRPLIENLDELPYPARHLFPMEKYKAFGIRYPAATLICSRGCPMQCTFCASSTMFGKKARFRSPRRVVEEIEYVRDKYGAKNIAFLDDTFTLYRKWVDQLCNELIQSGLDDIIWGCESRVDTVDKPMMEKMKKAGCEIFFVGVESGSQELLNQISKGTNIHQIKDFFHHARETGIRTIASLAFGFPGETKETIHQSIEFTKKINPDYAVFSVATPYPGTKFYELCERLGLIRVRDWAHYNLLTPIIQTMEITLDELKRLQIQAFKEFYFRPKWFAQTVWREGWRCLSVLKTIASILVKSEFKKIQRTIFGTHVDAHLALSSA